ncbi:Nif3-like dinuclear metal center hexameric protein [Shewanella sp. OPT22]|nr:Nif3-like dinuclear metal center hexameric protein [Shewanella sp. OPT22]
MTRNDLLSYLNDYLMVSKYRDYAPNGLQVEGTAQIKKIVTGVTASQALIDAAIAEKADALLVHHGYFWKGEPQQIIGMKQRRIKALLLNDINLMGYHLPLDGHPEVGNNIQLGEKLGLENIRCVEGVEQDLIWQGETSKPVSAVEFSTLLSNVLQREPMHMGDDSKLISKVTWCTGGAQDYLDVAVGLGVDAFISGEVSERTYHNAIEQGVHYFAAGHHATERYGIEALGNHLQEKFGLHHQFIDINNPV